MASSSSEGFDEIIYQCLSAVTDDNICKKDEIFVMCCPLCNQCGRSFYCSDCVKNGNFTHSKKKCFERFADKKPKKYKLDAEKSYLLQRYEDALSRKKQVENVKLNIYKCKEKIHLLKESIKCYKDKISKGERMILELKERNAHLLSNEAKFNDKLFKMRRYQRNRNEELEFKKIRLCAIHSALQSVIQSRTKELVTHIFPITKVAPYSNKNSLSEEGQYAELEEAQKTTYVQGQWVIAGSPMDDIHFSIVEPSIPSSGDYSAYINWCTDHIQGISRDNLSSVDKLQFDAAYGISAALAYTAQLVGILAFYLDAHVPKRSSFSDFCEYESSKERFLHKVAKLNANIVSLCLSQQVDMSKVNAHQTISNLLLLLDSVINKPKSLTYFEVKEDLMNSIENSVSKDLESDSDDNEAEFVHVLEEDFLEVPDRVPSESTHVQHSLVSSVFSLLRAVTGQR